MGKIAVITHADDDTYAVTLWAKGTLVARTHGPWERVSAQLRAVGLGLLLPAALVPELVGDVGGRREDTFTEYEPSTTAPERLR